MYIIPYQEKLGNYNVPITAVTITAIIPYQEKLGKYKIENKSYVIKLAEL